MIEPTAPQLATATRTFGLLLAPVRLHLVALACCGEYDVGGAGAAPGGSEGAPAPQQKRRKKRKI
ncbi:hypothetical protein ACWGID_39695, partial [Kribbella sp. NPDC054772]